MRTDGRSGHGHRPVLRLKMGALSWRSQALVPKKAPREKGSSVQRRRPTLLIRAIRSPGMLQQRAVGVIILSSNKCIQGTAGEARQSSLGQPAVTVGQKVRFSHPDASIGVTAGFSPSQQRGARARHT